MIFKILTIVMMAVFYACYFAKMISQSKRGIHTDQLGKGKEGFVRFVEITLKIVTCVLPFVQLISILLYAGAVCAPLRMIGMAITAVGVIVFIASVVQMEDNWRAGVQREDKTNLVTAGIYSVSRNPAFLGFDLMYIGILCSFYNYFLWCGTVLAILLFHFQIVNVEEDFLAETFGEEYLQYRKTVCRYIGRKRKGSGGK